MKLNHYQPPHTLCWQGRATNNPDDYDIRYFTSQKDAESKMNEIADYTAYDIKNGDSIFMTLGFLGASCVPIKTFKLHLTPSASGTFKYAEDASVTAFCKDSNS